MIPYEDVDRALNGHGAKFASLGLLKPIIRDGVAYIDERQWEALCARIVPGERRHASDWAELPERRSMLRLAHSRQGPVPRGNSVLNALRRFGRFRR
ncbi:MAG: hypothetical protein ACLQM8_01845 [Limisphaerales bacterium]